ncbi:hypothetical protein [Mesorhizobium sp. ES1-1]|uniref:hypothetical protein n=1 Tax=Mesorhizobium sp. ES1-1 TaxID=2876629 RepID=UPI001CCC4DC5|nr:hypothetical protein [Mesorhizobium sp. ES1-1]MBZ9676413.1 hypothetical protein [Mesorhizobium sp. ES1-1]
MVKILAAAMLTLSLAGGAMAQSSGTDGGNSNSGQGTTNGGTAGDNNSGNSAGGTAAGTQTDQSGATDKCKTGADGKTTTGDAATTQQEAQNCP